MRRGLTPASSRCVAYECRHSSSHYSSFVDGPDLLLAPSLLRTNGGDCPMVTAPNLGESRRQAPCWRPDRHCRVDARSSRVSSAPRRPYPMRECRRPARAPRRARSLALAPHHFSRYVWGITTERSACCPRALSTTNCLRMRCPCPIQPSGSSSPSHHASSATTSLPSCSRPWCTAHKARSLAMSEKMRPTHLHRTAYVSVRQSSHHQVRYHHASQRRQYA